MIKRIFFFTLAFLTLLSFSITATLAQSAETTPSPKKNWKLNLEAGATISRGNTNEESIYAKNRFDYTKGKWSEIFKSRLENTKVNRLRAKERYDLNNQLRQNINKKTFRLLELEYVDDRYSGYDHRISQTLGYGLNLIENDKTLLSAQFGAGLRQSRFTNGKNEYSWLARTGFHYNYKINKAVTFDESFDFAIDSEFTIIKSDSSLNIKLDSLNHSLYLQLGYFVERRSSTISPGIKRTDSTFMTMIGYNF